MNSNKINAKKKLYFLKKKISKNNNQKKFMIKKSHKILNVIKLKKKVKFLKNAFMIFK